MNRSIEVAQDRKEFLRDRIWNQSDVVLSDKNESNRFESVVKRLFEKLDLSQLHADRLLVDAYDFMRSENFEERDIGLFLTLLERSIHIVEVIERERDQLREVLQAELGKERANKEKGNRDRELIDRLNNELALLSGGTRNQIYPVLQEYEAPKEKLMEVEKMKSTFAGPYIRILLSRDNGNRRYTEQLRNQLATLLCQSPQSIAADKAWRSGELKGRAKTIETIIEKMRSRLTNGKKKGVKSPAAAITTMPSPHEKPEEADLSIVYSYIPDNNYAAFARSLEPTDFRLDDKGTIKKSQKKWIYALMLLGCTDEEGKKSLRQLLAEDIFHCSISKIGAVTAYLSGKHYEQAKAKKSDVWEDIEAIELFKDDQVSDYQPLLASETHEERVSDLAQEASGLQAKDPTGDSMPIEIDKNEVVSLQAGETGFIEVTQDYSSKKKPDYDNTSKEKGWRAPYRRMIEQIWGVNKPLRGKRMLILESPQLLEWQMLESLGAEESMLTVVERYRPWAEDISEKLPKATIVNATLMQYLAKKAARRLEDAGQTDKWSSLGVSPSNPRSYILSDQEELITLSPNSFYPNRFRTSCPQTVRKNSVGIPEDSADKFDIVSLDTQSLLPTCIPDIRLMLKLALLGTNAMLCTNFFAQREDKEKIDYQQTLLREGRLDPSRYFRKSGSWEERASTSLTTARSDAITVELLNMIKHGRNQRFACTAYNPFSQYYRSFIRHIGGIDPKIMADVLHFVEQNCPLPCPKEKLPPEVRAQYEAHVLANLFPYLLSEIFEIQCIEKFGTLDISEKGEKQPSKKQIKKYRNSHPEAKKGNSSLFGLMPPGNYAIPRDSIMAKPDIFPLYIGDIIMSALESRLDVVRHESYAYHHTSLFNADFFQIRTRLGELGISPTLLEALKKRLFGGPKEELNLEKLTRVLQRNMELQAKREWMTKLEIKRITVD